ncbi:MAG: hypothetical protein ABL983_14640 [Nitrospira sp.]
MSLAWVHYEICTEDDQGLDPFGLHYSTRGEAEAELRTYLPCYPGAFIVRVIATRCGARIPHRAIQVV